MLPAALRFELRPRRSRPLLRLALAVVCISSTAAVLFFVWQGQREIELLEQAVERARAQTPSASSVPASPQPTAAWLAESKRDERLFKLEVNDRLLEIERCTEHHGSVTRLAHDAAEGRTQMDVTLVSGEALAPMMECLNAGDGAHRWRLVSMSSAPDRAEVMCQLVGGVEDRSRGAQVQ